jgi:hypothetical protein
MSDARALTTDDVRRGEVGGPQAPRGAEWAIYAQSITAGWTVQDAFISVVLLSIVY